RAYSEAATVDERAAPRYTSLADCVAEFGAGSCHSITPSSGSASITSIFVPAMAGFLIGNAVAGLTQPAQPVYRRCDPNQDRCSDPYTSNRSYHGYYYTHGGYRVSTSGAGSSASVARSAFTTASASPTLSRGGFGARAASVSARS